MSIFIFYIPYNKFLRLTYPLATWLSSIGFLNAAIVALEIVKKHHEPSKIGHFKLIYYRKGLIIQIFNYSKTITFID